MYETLKKTICVIALFVVGFCFVGCKSTKIDSTGVGERNQYVRGRLDSTIKSLDRDLADCDRALQECTERSRGIEDLAARLKYLTSEYFRITKQIQDANNRALSELNAMEEDMQEPCDNVGCTDTGDSGSTIFRAY